MALICYQLSGAEVTGVAVTISVCVEHLMGLHQDIM